jgi:hypothetical protein
MEISSEKSEAVALLGQDQVRCKTAVDNRCLQQVNNFKCPGCKIAYGNKKDVQEQVAKFVQILGNSKQHFSTNHGPEIIVNNST